MIIYNILMVNITVRNITYYKNKGYDCKLNTVIPVKLEDINDGSAIKETRICDYCGKEYIRPHNVNISSYNRFKKDVCQECFHNNKEVKEIIQQHRENTFIKKYGVNNPSLDSNVVEKIAQTMLDRYGVRNSSQVEEFKRKQEETMLRLYGERKALQVPQFQEKFVKTMTEGQKVKTSKQQKACYNMLLEHNYDVQLNYPVSVCSLDVLITLDDGTKIDFEYDGTFWHDKGQKTQDRRRDEFLKKQGYKIFRLESDRGIPKWETLLEGINKLKNGHSFVHIEIDKKGNVIK